MSGGKRPVTLLCCGVVKRELCALQKEHWPDVKLRFVNSMLHMRPDDLARCLQAVVDEELECGNRVLIVYGDCCAQMADIEDRPGVARVRSNNCCALLLGKEEHRRLSHEGAFFLLPEWTMRWRHVFATQLGLNQENASNLMGDMHRKLVYLDTGLASVPREALDKCSQYCGLPFEVRSTSLECLRVAIEEALTRLENSGSIL